ncbi:MAG: preprotein translocase subunit YajC [Gemmatimonadetes bacterium]|nr:preprotein translocase subunit YajC [Gemmatimonadota bacterium]
MVLLLEMLAIFAIFYFLLIRPQRQAQRRHQQMLKALKRGDEVMTDGGILGEVVHIKEDRVTIRTAETTRLVVARPKIARVLSQAGEEANR